jgi:hypothetical protein
VKDQSVQFGTVIDNVALITTFMHFHFDPGHAESKSSIPDIMLESLDKVLCKTKLIR